MLAFVGGRRSPLRSRYHSGKHSGRWGAAEPQPAADPLLADLDRYDLGVDGAAGAGGAYDLSGLGLGGEGEEGEDDDGDEGMGLLAGLDPDTLSSIPPALLQRLQQLEEERDELAGRLLESGEQKQEKGGKQKEDGRKDNKAPTATEAQAKESATPAAAAAGEASAGASPPVSKTEVASSQAPAVEDRNGDAAPKGKSEAAATRTSKIATGEAEPARSASVKEAEPVARAPVVGKTDSRAVSQGGVGLDTGADTAGAAAAKDDAPSAAPAAAAAATAKPKAKEASTEAANAPRAVAKAAAIKTATGGGRKGGSATLVFALLVVVALAAGGVYVFLGGRLSPTSGLSAAPAAVKVDSIGDVTDAVERAVLADATAAPAAVHTASEAPPAPAPPPPPPDTSESAPKKHSEPPAVAPEPAADDPATNGAGAAESTSDAAGLMPEAAVKADHMGFVDVYDMWELLRAGLAEVAEAAGQPGAAVALPQPSCESLRALATSLSATDAELASAGKQPAAAAACTAGSGRSGAGECRLPPSKTAGSPYPVDARAEVVKLGMGELEKRWRQLQRTLERLAGEGDAREGSAAAQPPVDPAVQAVASWALSHLLPAVAPMVRSVVDDDELPESLKRAHKAASDVARVCSESGPQLSAAALGRLEAQLNDMTNIALVHVDGGGAAAVEARLDDAARCLAWIAPRAEAEACRLRCSPRGRLVGALGRLGIPRALLDGALTLGRSGLDERDGVWRQEQPPGEEASAEEVEAWLRSTQHLADWVEAALAAKEGGSGAGPACRAGLRSLGVEMRAVQATAGGGAAAAVQGLAAAVLPADCVRANLVSSWGRLNDADSSGAHAPIEPHQWLPGAWTPSLFGLSREWRVYARCVLTHTLTVDLAIAVSLQRPEMRSSSSGGPGSEPDAGSLEYFLSGFPSLQHLTILAGNGGAPVDENARPPGEANPNTASLAMAEPFGVALAAQQLLGLDRPRGATPVPELLAGGARAGGGGTGAYGNGSQASPSGHPRLTSLELRMHPAVWRVLSGSEPDQFLHRLTAVYPTGLAELTQLQSLSLEGVSPGSVQGSLGVLTGLTCLRFAETHHRPMAQDASAIPPTRNKGVTAAAMLHMQMHVPRAVPNQAPTLRALHLPDVTVGPMEWPALLRLCPLLQELEVASALPPRKELAAAAAAMASGASGSVPDWFVRATAGDEAVLSHGTNSGSSARNVRNGDGSLDSGPKNGADEAAGPPGKSAVAGLLTLRGVNRLVMWHYMGPHDMMLLLQHMPDVQELHAPLMMEDPPHVPAAMLRPAAVAMLRPLIDTIRHMRSVRLDVSCDPAAVTGQLAVVFLMESGLAEIRGMHRLALNVWVAAEAQLGALVVLAQLRSLDLTLGKQEQESELSVLTRLTRLSYLSLRITPGVWNEIQGRTGRVSAGAALRLAMSFAAGQTLLLVADVHREICEDEAISLVKSVEMTAGEPGAAWAVSAWVEETAECIGIGFGPGGGGGSCEVCTCEYAWFLNRVARRGAATGNVG
eukprot:XP_001695990.1 predicted protein [Chlamydomonas reinhardtii]